MAIRTLTEDEREGLRRFKKSLATVNDRAVVRTVIKNTQITHRDFCLLLLSCITRFKSKRMSPIDFSTLVLIAQTSFQENEEVVPGINYENTAIWFRNFSKEVQSCCLTREQNKILRKVVWDVVRKEDAKHDSEKK